MTKSKNKLSTQGRSAFLLTGSIIGFTIAFSPYIFYMYEIFPDGPVWENSFFIYESKYYLNVTTAMWTYFGKIMPLILLLIWFFTSKHWWYHSILIPISMYSYQLIYLAPFFIGVLFVLYFIRIKIFDRVFGIDLSELNETDVSVFSSGMSSREEKELELFRQQNPALANEPTEDYYRKL